MAETERTAEKALPEHPDSERNPSLLEKEDVVAPERGVEGEREGEREGSKSESPTPTTDSCDGEKKGSKPTPAGQEVTVVAVKKKRSTQRLLKKALYLCDEEEDIEPEKLNFEGQTTEVGGRAKWLERQRDRESKNKRLSKSKDGTFFSYVFLEKIFKTSRRCKLCGKDSGKPIMEDDDSLELFISEKGLCGRLKLACSSCNNEYLVLSCDNESDMVDDQDFRIDGAMIRYYCHTLNHIPLVHDLMDLLNVAAMEGADTRRQKHQDLAEFMLHNARKVCKEWCRQESTELRAKRFLRLREEVMIMRSAPVFTVDHNPEYREMYGMMASSFRQHRDKIKLLLELMKTTLFDNPTPSSFFLWVSIAMIHSESYQMFKERYDAKTFTLVDSTEYQALKDRYLGLNVSLGIKKIPVCFILFELPRFYQYIQFLKERLGKERPTSFLTEDDHRMLEKFDRQAHKYMMKRRMKSGKLVSIETQLDLLNDKEELGREALNRSTREKLEATKEERKRQRRLKKEERQKRVLPASKLQEEKVASSDKRIVKEISKSLDNLEWKRNQRKARMPYPPMRQQALGPMRQRSSLEKDMVSDMTLRKPYKSSSELLMEEEDRQWGLEGNWSRKDILLCEEDMMFERRVCVRFKQPKKGYRDTIPSCLRVSLPSGRMPTQEEVLQLVDRLLAIEMYPVSFDGARSEPSGSQRKRWREAEPDRKKKKADKEGERKNECDKREVGLGEGTERKNRAVARRDKNKKKQVVADSKPSKSSEGPLKVTEVETRKPATVERAELQHSSTVCEQEPVERELGVSGEITTEPATEIATEGEEMKEDVPSAVTEKPSSEGKRSPSSEGELTSKVVVPALASDLTLESVAEVVVPALASDMTLESVAEVVVPALASDLTLESVAEVVVPALASDTTLESVAEVVVPALASDLTLESVAEVVVPALASDMTLESVAEVVVPAFASDMTLESMAEVVVPALASDLTLESVAEVVVPALASDMTLESVAEVVVPALASDLTLETVAEVVVPALASDTTLETVAEVVVPALASDMTLESVAEVVVPALASDLTLESVAEVVVPALASDMTLESVAEVVVPALASDLTLESVAEVVVPALASDMTLESVAEVVVPAFASDMTLESMAEVVVPALASDLTLESVAEVVVPALASDMTLESVAEVVVPALASDLTLETVAEVVVPALASDTTLETVAEVVVPALASDMTLESVAEVVVPALASDLTLESVAERNMAPPRRSEEITSAGDSNLLNQETVSPAAVEDGDSSVERGEEGESKPTNGTVGEGEREGTCEQQKEETQVVNGEEEGEREERGMRSTSHENGPQEAGEREREGESSKQERNTPSVTVAGEGESGVGRNSGAGERKKETVGEVIQRKLKRVFDIISWRGDSGESQKKEESERREVRERENSTTESTGGSHDNLPSETKTDSDVPVCQTTIDPEGAPSEIDQSGSVTGSDMEVVDSDKESVESAGSEEESVGSAGSEEESVGSAGSEEESAGSGGSEEESVGSAGSDKESVGSARSDKESVGSAWSDRESVKSAGSDRESVGSVADTPEEMNDNEQTVAVVPTDTVATTPIPEVTNPINPTAPPLTSSVETTTNSDLPATEDASAKREPKEFENVEKLSSPAPCDPTSNGTSETAKSPPKVESDAEEVKKISDKDEEGVAKEEEEEEESKQDKQITKKRSKKMEKKAKKLVEAVQRRKAIEEKYFHRRLLRRTPSEEAFEELMERKRDKTLAELTPDEKQLLMDHCHRKKRGDLMEEEWDRTMFSRRNQPLGPAAMRTRLRQKLQERKMDDDHLYSSRSGQKREGRAERPRSPSPSRSPDLLRSRTKSKHSKATEREASGSEGGKREGLAPPTAPPPVDGEKMVEMEIEVDIAKFMKMQKTEPMKPKNEVIVVVERGQTNSNFTNESLEMLKSSGVPIVTVSQPPPPPESPPRSVALSRDEFRSLLVEHLKANEEAERAKSESQKPVLMISPTPSVEVLHEKQPPQKATSPPPSPLPLPLILLCQQRRGR